MIEINLRDVQRGTPMFKKLWAQGVPMKVMGKDGFMFFITHQLEKGHLGQKNTSRSTKDLLQAQINAIQGMETPYIPDTDFGA